MYLYKYHTEWPMYVFVYVVARSINSYRKQYRVQYEDSNFKIYRPSEAQGNCIVLMKLVVILNL
jgi:hypothetical protein